MLLTTEHGHQWPLTISGRLQTRAESTDITLGEGADTLSLVAFGQKPLVHGGSLRFSEEGEASRAALDADLTGVALSLRAKVLAGRPAATAWSRLRSWINSAPSAPRPALILLGEPGHFVALLGPSSEAPAQLEWALGPGKRGLMSALNTNGSARHLGLAIDSRGELAAFWGEGEEQQPIGETVNFGGHWKKLFGRFPKAALGCLGGNCLFEQVRLSAQRELPPPPEPVRAPKPINPPKPVNAPKSVSRPKSASAPKAPARRQPLRR